MSKKAASWVVDRMGACIPPVGDNENDELLWSRDIANHSQGQFSLAAVQANEMMEDKSQVEPGKNATFVGIYDGHGGTVAANFVLRKLFGHLLDLAKTLETISEEMIKSAFTLTENSFQLIVANEYNARPHFGTVGSCCLVGVIWESKLLIANLGDSRAVIGYLNNRNKLVNQQLTQDHNVSNSEVRNELTAAHEESEQVLVFADGVYRIKGVMQVSRAIGDAFLKIPAIGNDPRYHLQTPLTRPIIRADPTTSTLHLTERHKFVIFASDGLWEFLANQEAVDIVAKGPNEGIAKKLIKKALKKAARRRNTTYKKMKKLDPSQRRDFHDDITVVVLFIDLDYVDRGPLHRNRLSVHALRNDDTGAIFDF